jgi:hypothetical protein
MTYSATNIIYVTARYAKSTNEKETSWIGNKPSSQLIIKQLNVIIKG